MATKEREEFLAHLQAKVGKNWWQVLEAGRAAMRMATAEQRWCELECSAHMDDKAIADGERKSERRRERMAAIARALGVTFEAQGDPRGAVYTLAGLAVPAQGYTDEQINRIRAYWERVQEMRARKPAAGEVRP